MITFDDLLFKDEGDLYEGKIQYASHTWSNGDYIVVYRIKPSCRKPFECLWLLDRHTYHVFSSRQGKATEGKGYVTKQQLKKHLSYINSKSK